MKPTEIIESITIRSLRGTIKRNFESYGGNYESETRANLTKLANAISFYEDELELDLIETKPINTGNRIGRLEKTAPMNDERLLLQTVRRELEGFIEKL